MTLRQKIFLDKLYKMKFLYEGKIARAIGHEGIPDYSGLSESLGKEVRNYEHCVNMLNDFIIMFIEMISMIPEST